MIIAVYEDRSKLINYRVTPAFAIALVEGVPNLGDAISPVVLAHVSGRPVGAC